ncbi:MAG: hypothetical protein ACHQ7N_20890 [Candidatus Methylomirabilales bacterium]
MSRTVISDSIRDTFLDTLKSLGASVDTMSNLASTTSDPRIRPYFEYLGHASRDVYLVRGVGLINVHIRSEPPGWWNILKTVKEDLDVLRMRLGVERLFVLLVGRNDRFVADGYIATEFDKPPFLRHPGIETKKYSINEKSHLDALKKILSIEKLAKGLLGAKKAV